MKAGFTIAVDGWENGEKTAYFFSAEVWTGKDSKNGGQAQYVADHARKGSLVFIQGSLGQQKWQDRDSGQKREKTVIRVASIVVIPKTTQSEQHEEPAPATKPPQPTAIEPDDIPF